MNELKIVFMGTPEFAVPSLDTLLKNNCTIVGVVTATDKPAGRGNALQQSAVKKYALAHNLTILQPPNLKSEQFIQNLESLNANLFIVVAFRMLPEVVWRMPSLGTFNLHASLLPQYRGAAPINWAIINGEKETGVTTFFLQHEIDTGNIILQEKVTIQEDDNVGSVHDKLMTIGATLVLKTVQAIEHDRVDAMPQKNKIQANDTLRHAPKIFKETCLVDWNKPAIEIHNLVRGLSPYPAAFTYLDNKVLKLFKTNIRPIHTHNEQLIASGKYITDHKTFLAFKSNDAFLDILELQLEGKKRMPIKEFLRGYKLS